MKVTVVYQYYQGFDAPGHSLIYEMTQALTEHNHDVTVISGESNYMRPDRPKLPWYKRLYRYERDGLVKVLRIYTPVNLQRSYCLRILGFFSFSVNTALSTLFGRKPDVLFASSPPLFPMLAVVWICQWRRIPLVFEVRDLWPASIVELGLVRNRWLIALMAWMEKISYAGTAQIVALTRGIKSDIEARGWPAKKVHVITCGINTDMLFPDPKEGAKIRTEHGWQNHEIVLYLGAMGESHHLDVILDAARECKRPQMLFVLIGDGMLRTHLQAQINALQLNNFQILPAIPKTMVRGYICAADICLTTLKDITLFQGAIPTKLLDYMACGRPVLCGISGEAADIVKQSGAGWVFPPDDAACLARMAENLLADPPTRLRMGEAGVRYVRNHFDIKTKHRAMIDLLEDVVAGKSPRSKIDTENNIKIKSQP